MLSKLSFENQVNIVGGLVIVLIGGYVITEVIRTRDTPACQFDYPPATQMSFLRTNGVPMAPAELQARIGVGERGIIDKASIVKSDGPDGWAMMVKTGAPQENEPAVSFQWSPSNIGNATAACLTYSVFLPRNFGFSQSGYLPGLIGDMFNASRSAGGSQSGFGARPKWTENGTFQFEANTSEAGLGGEAGARIPAKDSTLPRGRWFRIDQELVLNTPNALDGKLRVWLDGKLVIDQSKLAWRGHGGIRIAGVGADIGYAHMKTNILPTRTPSEIRISPIQISWRSAQTTASSN